MKKLFIPDNAIFGNPSTSSVATEMQSEKSKDLIVQFIESSIKRQKGSKTREMSVMA